MNGSQCEVDLQGSRGTYSFASHPVAVQGRIIVDLPAGDRLIEGCHEEDGKASEEDVVERDDPAVVDRLQQGCIRREQASNHNRGRLCLT